jgi:hypothetical protein
MLSGILHVGLLPRVFKSWQIQIMLHVIMWQLSCSTEFHSPAILQTFCFQLVPYRNIHRWLANTLWSCMQSFFLPPKCHHPPLLHVHVSGSPLMNMQIPFSLNFWNYFQQITSLSFASFKCNLPWQTKKKTIGHWVVTASCKNTMTHSKHPWPSFFKFCHGCSEKCH